MNHTAVRHRGRRSRILFVIRSFSQGGSERWLYEMSRALRTRGWLVEILTSRSADTSQHYYSELRSLGFQIHRRIPVSWVFNSLMPGLYRTKPGRRIFDWMNRLKSRWLLGNLFENYDVISIIQIENYVSIQSSLPHDAPVVVHLMSNAFQYDHSPYEACDPSRRYRFVLMDPAQRRDLRGSPCEAAETVYLPLGLDFSGRRPLQGPRRSEGPVRIGVFIRLSSQRPLEPLFYCLQSVLQEVGAVLHVYGRGDPAPFRRTIELLGLEGHVVFCGHATSIRHALEEDEISMVWMTCHDRALGYASIEVASFGVPIAFWNLGRADAAVLAEQTDGALAAFQTVKQFADHTIPLVGSPERLAEEGARLLGYVRKKHDIERIADEIDRYYRKVRTEGQRGLGGQPGPTNQPFSSSP